MKKVAEHIDGYTFGTPEVAPSAVSMQQLEDLKVSAGFTEEDRRYLQLAGTVLEDQTRQIVEHWRSGIIAGIPNLARHSRTPEGEPNPDYLAKSNLRFQQWILDTCLRPYDQAWLDLSARDCSPAHEPQEESDRSRQLYIARTPARHPHIYRRNQRDDQSVSCGEGSFPRGSGGYAPGLV